MCMTSFHPPLEKYYFASVRGLASNRSERPCLAARTLLLQTSRSALLRSVVIFVKYRAQGFYPYDIAKFHQQLQEQLYIRVLPAIVGRAQLRRRGGRVRP
jgi:hypothetical protein